ncbi:MAG: nucleotide exchange factor GrpE [Gammaproteobacteria bacterium]
MSKKSNKENTSKIEEIETSKDLELEEKELTEENEIDTLEEENKVLSELVKGLEEKVLRAQAEVENVRKTSQKEILKSRIFSAESITKDLLTAIDNLHRSLEHSESGIPSSLIELVLKDISKALSNQNIEEIDPLGEKFNPNFHEALSVKENKNKESEEILEVLQKGYKIQDRIIRPALVVVNKV